MKRSVKDGSYNRKGKIFCYTSQLGDRAEKVNTHKNKLFVTFIQVTKKSFGQGFDPTNLLSSDTEKKSYAQDSARAIAKMM